MWKKEVFMAFEGQISISGEISEQWSGKISEIDGKAVVCEADVRREFGVHDLMKAGAVTHMDKPCLFCINFFGKQDGLTHILVCRVFFGVQGVYHQYFGSAYESEIAAVDCFHIRYIGQIAYPESQDGHIAMHDLYRHYLNSGSRKGLSLRYFNQLHCRGAGLLLLAETVWDTLHNMLYNILPCIYGHFRIGAVWAKVVQTAYMVVVFVGKQDGINALHTYPEGLLTKIRSAVNHYISFPGLY
jgi:hypothetical protein